MQQLVPTSLFVAWQDPESRLILPIGRLSREGIGYSFEYLRSALDARARSPFRALYDFPRLAERSWSERLFPLFQNRLMPAARPDYPEYIRALGLDPAEVDPMGVLARSGGTRVTDRIELFASPTYDPTQRAWVTYFLLRGIRHRGEDAEQRVLHLAPGERLDLCPDPHNPYNPAALRLGTGGVELGFLPDYLATEARPLWERPGALEVIVERLNPPPIAAQQRLLCRLLARWPADAPPFTGPAYTSLVDDPEARRLDAEAEASRARALEAAR